MQRAPITFNSYGNRPDNRFWNAKFQQQPCQGAQHHFQRRQGAMDASQPLYSSYSADGDEESFGGSPQDVSSSGSSVSNLSRFLESTTPRISPQFYSKSHPFSLGFKGCPKQFFLLSDLWDTFDEWSAYGAGVPIVLDGKETVMQYYVPYLSAIQLYTSAGTGLFMKNRRFGDDSDSSEMDYRDSISEISSDGEAEKLSSQDGYSVNNDNYTLNHEPWNSSDAGDRSSKRGGNETLLFEYFEAAAPSLRVPLYDKVDELARQFPGLKSLRSDDLSPSSWLSVAWYPIYRIPTGPTLKDMGACFLTYHSLSTLQSDVDKDMVTALSQDMTLPSSQNQVALHPFGLASYKFRGAVWSAGGASDRQRAASLQRSTDEWLKRLDVHHPDFKYFMSHCVPTRR